MKKFLLITSILMTTVSSALAATEFKCESDRGPIEFILDRDVNTVQFTDATGFGGAEITKKAIGISLDGNKNGFKASFEYHWYFDASYVLTFSGYEYHDKYVNNRMEVRLNGNDGDGVELDETLSCSVKNLPQECTFFCGNQ